MLLVSSFMALKLALPVWLTEAQPDLVLIYSLRYKI
jgi:hypothetical protein